MGDLQYFMRARLKKCLQDSKDGSATFMANKENVRMVGVDSSSWQNPCKFQIHKDYCWLFSEHLFVKKDGIELEIEWEHVLKVY